MLLSIQEDDSYNYSLLYSVCYRIVYTSFQILMSVQQALTSVPRAARIRLAPTLAHAEWDTL